MLHNPNTRQLPTHPGRELHTKSPFNLTIVRLDFNRPWNKITPELVPHRLSNRKMQVAGHLQVDQRLTAPGIYDHECNNLPIN